MDIVEYLNKAGFINKPQCYFFGPRLFTPTKWNSGKSCMEHGVGWQTYSILLQSLRQQHAYQSYLRQLRRIHLSAFTNKTFGANPNLMSQIGKKKNCSSFGYKYSTALYNADVCLLKIIQSVYYLHLNVTVLLLSVKVSYLFWEIQKNIDRNSSSAV